MNNKMSVENYNLIVETIEMMKLFKLKKPKYLVVKSRISYFIIASLFILSSILNIGSLGKHYEYYIFTMIVTIFLMSTIKYHEYKYKTDKIVELYAYVTDIKYEKISGLGNVLNNGIDVSFNILNKIIPKRFRHETSENKNLFVKLYVIDGIFEGELITIYDKNNTLKNDDIIRIYIDRDVKLSNIKGENMLLGFYDLEKI